MKFYLVFLFCYVHGLLFAQFNFTYKDSIPVHAFGQQLKMTWSGGLNNAQFSELDFDFDGDNDLLVFDRSADQIRLFENMGSEYTCKDFRTYSANILFIKAFLKNSKQQKNIKKVIIKSIDDSAKLLGHSRSISKKSYISENLINYCTGSFIEASGSTSSELLCKVWESSS